jgi:hypothetical protein
MVIKKPWHSETEYSIFNFLKTVDTQPINFFFSYGIDEQEAEPALLLADSLKKFHKEGTGNAAYQHLVQSEEVKEWVKKLSLVRQICYKLDVYRTA